MPPKWTDLVLAAYIPHIEFCIFVRHGLNIKANGRNRCYVGVELELVQDSCS